MHEQEAKITEKVCHANSRKIRITEKGGRPLITPPHQGPRASTSSDCKRQLNATLREIKFGDPDIRGHPNPN